MTKRDYHPTPFRKMVALGESTTAGGWSSSRERCWVSLLAELISDFQAEPVECVNAGIGGNVISPSSPAYDFSGKPAASERLDKHVIAHAPDLIVIAYGLNDARGGTSLPLFLETLTQIVLRLQRECQAVLVLLGPFYMIDFAGDWSASRRRWNHASLDLFHKYSDAIKSVAVDNNCLFVDILGANGHTDWMVHYDGVHANDLGHRIIANRVFEVLAQNCSGLAVRTKALEQVSPRWRDESMLKADYGYVRRDGRDVFAPPSPQA
jgi:lysophospholipase L1-like esterase